MGLVLLLTNNDISLPLADMIRDAGWHVLVSGDAVDAAYLRDIGADIAVSYNYRHIIGADVISSLPGKIFNLHISLLPWNRGADPNIWSFIDGTPKGVTIHAVAPSVDAGDILFQQELEFDERAETFASTYAKLQSAIQRLFIDNWQTLISGRSEPAPQSVCGGSYHRRADLDPIRRYIDLTRPISDIIGGIRERLASSSSDVTCGGEICHYSPVFVVCAAALLLSRAFRLHQRSYL